MFLFLVVPFTDVFVSSIKPIRNVYLLLLSLYIFISLFVVCFNWRELFACAPPKCHTLRWFHCVNWIVETATEPRQLNGSTFLVCTAFVADNFHHPHWCPSVSFSQQSPRAHHHFQFEIRISQAWRCRWKLNWSFEMSRCFRLSKLSSQVVDLHWTTSASNVQPFWKDDKRASPNREPENKKRKIFLYCTQPRQIN